ncbi:hypothetical protein BDQ17DRAFT_1335818 [Cyathus striatus]|nr:hypothetical protein BDQ17DRAFT_1335818 [Cyathus striatus]
MTTVEFVIFEASKSYLENPVKTITDTLKWAAKEARFIFTYYGVQNEDKNIGHIDISSTTSMSRAEAVTQAVEPSGPRRMQAYSVNDGSMEDKLVPLQGKWDQRGQHQPPRHQSVKEGNMESRLVLASNEDTVRWQQHDDRKQDGNRDTLGQQQCNDNVL